MTELGIPFVEHMMKFDSKEWENESNLRSPSGLVPVLWEGELGTGIATFDSLAIIERLHELNPDRLIWPENDVARARARSLVADFHAGYPNLRSAMPMNIRSTYFGEGLNETVQEEIDRLCQLWKKTRAEFGYGGQFLFGKFSAVDAYFTPVASRFQTYGVSLSSEASEYQSSLLNTESMKNWILQALQETEFVAVDEPYAATR